ncbi:MAG: Hsp70 family protein, partial [Hydrogenovibrio sp.]
AHAEEDAKLKELVEARNQADAMIHGTKKLLDEQGEGVDAAEKEVIEKAIADLEEAIKGDDKSVIDEKSQALAAASQKLAEKAYAQQPGGDAGAQQQGGANNADDDIVDAEFEEVKDDKK